MERAHGYALRCGQGGVRALPERVYGRREGRERAEGEGDRADRGEIEDKERENGPGCRSHMRTKFFREVTGLSNMASFVVIVLFHTNEHSRGESTWHGPELRCTAGVSTSLSTIPVRAV